MMSTHTVVRRAHGQILFRLSIVLSSCFCVVGCGKTVTPVANIVERFDDNAFDQERWKIAQVDPATGTVEVKDGVMLIIAPPASEARPQIRNKGRFSFAGDFDAAIDFKLLTPIPDPEKDYINLEVIISGPNGTAHLSRVNHKGRGNGVVAYFQPSTKFGKSVWKHWSTEDTSGTLKLVRRGGTVEFFFVAEHTGDPVSIAAAQLGTGPIEEMSIALSVSSPTRDVIKVAVDNIEVHSRPMSRWAQSKRWFSAAGLIVVAAGVWWLTRFTWTKPGHTETQIKPSRVERSRFISLAIETPNRLSGGQTLNKQIRDIDLALCLMTIFVVFFAISRAIFSTPEHDYLAYIEQWDAIIQGENKWAARGAYGPLHDVLAFAYSHGSNLPKLAFVIFWLISSLGIIVLAKRNSDLPVVYVLSFYFILLLNPLFWIFVVQFGTNDVFMTFFVLLSVALYRQQKDIAAGLFMAVAISVKFIPIVMVPFLVLSGKLIRWYFAFSLVAFLVLVFGLSYWVLGNDILHPFQMAAERQSKLLSIFRFLRGSYSPIRLITSEPNVDWMSTYFCFGALLVLLLLHVRYEFDSTLSSIVSILLLLMFFKVGHHQFYITPIMLIALWIALDFKMVKTFDVSLVPVFMFIAWISLTAFLYMLTNRYEGTGWRDILGLPTFLITGWMLVTMGRLLAQSSRD